MTRAIEIVREEIAAWEKGCVGSVTAADDPTSIARSLVVLEVLRGVLSRLEAEEGEPLPEDAATDAPVVVTIEGSYCGCENSNEDEACVNTSNGPYVFPRSCVRVRRA